METIFNEKIKALTDGLKSIIDSQQHGLIDYIVTNIVTISTEYTISKIDSTNNIESGSENNTDFTDNVKSDSIITDDYKKGYNDGKYSTAEECTKSIKKVNEDIDTFTKFITEKFIKDDELKNLTNDYAIAGFREGFINGLIRKQDEITTSINEIVNNSINSITGGIGISDNNDLKDTNSYYKGYKLGYPKGYKSYDLF